MQTMLTMYVLKTFFYKVLKIVSGGYVINGAYPKDPPIVPYQKSESFNAIL